MSIYAPFININSWLLLQMQYWLFYNVFFQIWQCICLNLNMYLSILQLALQCKVMTWHLERVLIFTFESCTSLTECYIIVLIIIITMTMTMTIIIIIFINKSLLPTSSSWSQIIIVITDHHQILFLNQVGPWQRLASRGQTHFGRSRNPTSSSTRWSSLFRFQDG